MSEQDFNTRFHASIRDYLTKIEEVMLQDDLAAAKKLGHKMLGLCQLFGSPEQIILCEEIENAQSECILRHALLRFYILINDIK